MSDDIGIDGFAAAIKNEELIVDITRVASRGDLFIKQSGKQFWVFEGSTPRIRNLTGNKLGRFLALVSRHFAQFGSVHQGERFLFGDRRPVSGHQAPAFFGSRYLCSLTIFSDVPVNNVELNGASTWEHTLRGNLHHLRCLPKHPLRDQHHFRFFCSQS